MPGGIKLTIWILFAIFSIIILVWIASILGYVPITFTNAHTAGDLIGFLNSPRDDMRAIKINGHFLEIGRRPSLQILKPYDRPFYMVRPYRKVRLIPLNMTKTEVIDFCLGINGKKFSKLRANANCPDPSHAWKAVINKNNVEILRITHFTYLVYGLRQGRPLVIGQVELAKKLGIPDKEIMSYIIPVQDAWYINLMTMLNRSNKAFPTLPGAKDVLRVQYMALIHLGKGESPAKSHIEVPRPTKIGK
ncbi:MAG: hypothetical protein J7J85_06610 [Deltaproteobacteria bacterium]|nr:hypothetical protein [Deltaproteobacteria bacterium]